MGGATSSIVESMVVEAKKGSAGGCCTTISELVSEGREPTECVSPASASSSSGSSGIDDTSRLSSTFALDE
jgi:hypothetical protein